jgi:hypothetical protein
VELFGTTCHQHVQPRFSWETPELFQPEGARFVFVESIEVVYQYENVAIGLQKAQSPNLHIQIRELSGELLHVEEQSAHSLDGVESRKLLQERGLACTARRNDSEA